MNGIVGDYVNNIDIRINNGRTMRIVQTETDKNREGIGVETLDENGNLEERELIDEGDFVMLINYYRYIKEYDIKNDFINRDGINNEEDYSYQSQDMEL